jgi:hypothetical protein
VVQIDVTNSDPDLTDDTATIDEDTAVVVSPLSNDNDSDGDILAIFDFTAGEHGSVEFGSTLGTLKYTPSSNWHGTDTFTYWVDDGFGGLASALVTVTVNPVNDAPTIDTAPVFVQKNTPRDIDLRTLVTDAETVGDDLTFAVSNAQNGTIELLSDGYTARFTPTSGYAGAASFSLSVTDTGDGASAALTTSATVSTPVNTPPTASDGAATFHLAPGESATAYASWSDPDGDTVTVTAITQPAYGSVALNAAGTGFVYTAGSPAYVGDVTFEYTVSDGRGGTVTRTITITLANQAPTGTDVTLHAAARHTVTLTVPPSYSDLDGDTLTITAITQPANGSVTVHPSGAGVVYTPPTGFTGTVTFDYTVSDGHGGTVVVHVTLTITA